MSLDILRTTRGWLVSSSSLKPLVNSNNIKVGWSKLPDSFPCIIITQMGGTDTGYLGYKSSAAGSRLRKEYATIQVDILDKINRLNTIIIGDIITPVLMVSSQCSKVGDIETYDDTLSAYRKVQTYSMLSFHND